MGSTSEDPYHPWSLPVRDAVDRERALRMGIRGRDIVCLPPPGEAFLLDAAGARRWSAYLSAAADRAEKQP